MVTCGRVRELFNYREDGTLVRKIKTSNRVKVGDVAGTKHKGAYDRIYVDCKQYYTHRIIWLWHYGYMPENNLDHINRDKQDSRIENLREVSHQCNLRNTGNPKTNKSGVKGVYVHPYWASKWEARIVLSSKRCTLGSFSCFDEAVLHRLAAEQCLGWDGCDSTSPAYLYAVENNLIRR